MSDLERVIVAALWEVRRGMGWREREWLERLRARIEQPTDAWDADQIDAAVFRHAPALKALRASGFPVPALAAAE